MFFKELRDGERTRYRGLGCRKAGLNVRDTLQYGYNYAGVWPTATLSFTYAPVPATATRRRISVPINSRICPTVRPANTSTTG